MYLKIGVDTPAQNNDTAPLHTEQPWLDSQPQCMISAINKYYYASFALSI